MAPHLLVPLGVLACVLFGLERRSLGLLGMGLALGWGLASAEAQKRRDWQAEVDVQRPVVLQGQVQSHGIQDEDGWRCLLKAVRVEQGGRSWNIKERVWLRLPSSRTPILGEHLDVKGYLRRGLQAANGVSSRPRPWTFRVESELLLLGTRPGGWPWRQAHVVRQQVSDALERLEDAHGLGPWGGAWLRALLLGERHRIQLSQRQSLRRLGLAHLLAVSGLHLAMVLTGFWVVTCPLPWRLRILLAAVATWTFVGLIGLQPSMARAAVMASVGLLALAAKRPPEPRNALALAVLALLLMEPGWIHDVGFRLSVSATAGILWWAPAWTDAAGTSWQRLPRSLRASLAVTLAAQLATLPWVMTLHGGVHPSAVVLNLVALPWLALFLVCSLAALGLAASAWTLPLASPLAGVVDGLSRLAAWVCEWPASSWHWRPWPEEGWLLLSVVGGWGLRRWAERWPKTWRRRCTRWTPILAMALMLQGGPSSKESAGLPELAMLDVGQGDAFLLRDGDEAVLVDGGGWRRGDAGGRILWPTLASWKLPTLRAVLITHGDTDHCAGVRDLLRYLPVEEVWMSPGVAARGRCPRRVLETPGGRWRPLWRGDQLRVGRWRLRVLSPGAEDDEDGNDASMVLEASVYGRRFLLTGDIEATGERRLLSRLPEPTPYDVLKVPHHGSKTSTGRALLRRVQPRLALVSAGPNNSYGHPNPDVVSRLRRAGSVVLRTDLSGLVRLVVSPEGKLHIATPGAPRGDLSPRPR